MKDIALVGDPHFLRELAGHYRLDLHDPDRPGFGDDVVAEVALGIHDGQNKAVIDVITPRGVIHGFRHLTELFVRDEGVLFRQMSRDQFHGALFFPVQFKTETAVRGLVGKIQARQRNHADDHPEQSQ